MYNKYEELLKETGKTSYQVSKDTGIAQSTLSDWKSGKSQPKMDKLQILAEYFAKPITYFIENAAVEEKTA
ncbi:MAG: helix-turn-helix transcriptional regulator [Agathobacter sp.]|nr:helix-turn-helix transcriptional regulator [Agathobacter sp.]